MKIDSNNYLFNFNELAIKQNQSKDSSDPFDLDMRQKEGLLDSAKNSDDLCLQPTNHCGHTHAGCTNRC